MNTAAIGLSIHTVGEVLVGYTALAVHYRVFKKHKIDRSIITEMHHEQFLGAIGITLIFVGYAMEMHGIFF